MREKPWQFVFIIGAWLIAGAIIVGIISAEIALSQADKMKWFQAKQADQIAELKSKIAVLEETTHQLEKTSPAVDNKGFIVIGDSLICWGKLAMIETEKEGIRHFGVTFPVKFHARPIVLASMEPAETRKPHEDHVRNRSLPPTLPWAIHLSITEVDKYRCDAFPLRYPHGVEPDTAVINLYPLEISYIAIGKKTGP